MKIKRRQLKPNNIYHGDCLNLMKYIPDNSIDMILCDLPYEKTANNWDSIIPIELLWEEYKRIIKNNCAICLFCSQPFTTLLINSNINELKHHWIWEKEHRVGFQIAKYRPLMITEEIIVFCKNGSKLKYYPIKIKRTSIRRSTGASTYSGSSPLQKLSKQNLKYNDKYPTNLLKYKRDNIKLHPTQKPIELCKYLIKTYTQKDEIVLDNCIGSGTTCCAAKLTGRKYIGIEKNKKYFEIAKKRIKNTQLPMHKQKWF